ncbi:hypothetical protein VTO42DRAFT_3872 [Malbranchea cinnamomea]
MSAQTGPTPLPPTKILKSERISQAAAHDFLAAYLERAATDPSLQPDSTLSGHGPVSANTGAAPNLVLHNLKRVQAGLAGQILGRDLTFLNQAGVFELQSHQFTDGQDWSGQKGKKGADDGWQDAQVFAREQVDLVEGGDGEDQGDKAELQIRDDMEVDDIPRKETIDKEERKRRKKERRKEEKRAKAARGS